MKKNTLIIALVMSMFTISCKQAEKTSDKSSEKTSETTNVSAKKETVEDDEPRDDTKQEKSTPKEDKENLSELVAKYYASTGQKNVKTLVKDDVNAYMRTSTGTGADMDNPKIFTDWGLWKSKKGNFLGAYETVLGDVMLEGFTFLSFYDAKNQAVSDIFDSAIVKKNYDLAFAKMSARGSEGTEFCFAEMPKTGTTIKLHIVLRSEMLQNKGVPKWKMQFGELQFNKESGKFKFVSKS